MEYFFMLFGFCLAAYSIVANDSIQTLGTFLNSNQGRKWWQLWLFAGGILSAVVVYGWYANGGDPSYGRLSKIPHPDVFTWVHIIPPLLLLVLTRLGFPVSTTFLVLTLFSQKALVPMLSKSLLGYLVAFVGAFFLYFLVSKLYQKYFLDLASDQKNKKFWVTAQWVSTCFLWTQWLVQDLANIFVYLPRSLSFFQLSAALGVMLVMSFYIFYGRGGKIQRIVRSKTNTGDIRSATFIDLIFAFLLFYFKGLNNIPMSTTWVFIGLLAGRELAISIRLKTADQPNVWPMIFKDLGKAGAGLAVSVIIAVSLPFLHGLTEGSEPEYAQQLLSNPKCTELLLARK